MKKCVLSILLALCASAAMLANGFNSAKVLAPMQMLEDEEATVEIVMLPAMLFPNVKDEGTVYGLMPVGFLEDPQVLTLFEELGQAQMFVDTKDIEQSIATTRQQMNDILASNPSFDEEQKRAIRSEFEALIKISQDRLDAVKGQPKPDCQQLANRILHYLVGQKYYRSIEEVNSNLFVVKDVDSYRMGCIDANGRMILPHKFTSILFSRGEPGYFSVDMGEGDENLCGLYSWEGKEILPCKYNYVGFLPGMKMVGVFEKKTLLGGFFDLAGKQVVPFTYVTYNYWNAQYKDGTSFQYCCVRAKNGKEGIIDASGKLVVPCILNKDNVGNNYDDSIEVTANGKPATLYFKGWRLVYK